MDWPEAQRNSFTAQEILPQLCTSSELSPQSSSPSQTSVAGTQRELLHANCVASQVTLVQPSSSEPSKQSFSESQWNHFAMQSPEVHWNWFAEHVGRVQFCLSSDPSEQSSSPSQMNVLGMHRPLLHGNSDELGHAYYNLNTYTMFLIKV